MILSSHRSRARIHIISLGNWPPGQCSDCQHRIGVPSRVSHHTVDRAHSYSFSTWQCYYVLSRSGVDADPSACDASFCQLSLSSLHLSIRTRLVEGKFSKDLLAELCNHSNSRLAGQSPPCGMTVMSNLISSYHECSMANQPAYDRQRQLQLDSDSCF